MKTLLIIFMALASFTALATPRHVVIIRHAEKPDGNEGQLLSALGELRAQALVSYVKESPDMNRLGIPSFIFAAKPKKESSSIRSIQTVAPLAKALHLPINAEYTRDDYDKLVHHVLKDPQYNDKTIFIAWGHSKIVKMARAFGAYDSPDAWEDDEFDRAWIIHFKNNKFESFENIKQNIQ